MIPLRLAIVAVLLGSAVPASASPCALPFPWIVRTQADLDALAGCTSFTSNLYLSGDAYDFSPLDGLKTVDGQLGILYNVAVVTVDDAFPSLTSVTGSVRVENNPELVDLSGFAALESAGAVVVRGNPSLERVAGFDALTTSDVLLYTRNPRLTVVPEFPALKALGALLVTLNDSLPEITGFRLLESLGQESQGVVISANPSLDNLCGLHNVLSIFAVPSRFLIYNNGPGLPEPTTAQDIIDAGPCAVVSLRTLSDAVDRLPLGNGAKSALKAKLDNASKSLEKGNAFAAFNQVMAFMNQVEALVRSRRLSAEQGEELIDAATRILDGLNA